MSRIFWDTNLFIYLLEESGERAERVQALALRMDERGDHLYTSTLTLAELLVKPVEEKNEELVLRIESTLGRIATLIPFDEAVARHYAAVRHDRTIKGPDAIQLACASRARVDMFITNDLRLAGKIVPGVQFVVHFERVWL